jgi:DNA-directed RNA polymerase subunit M/transcription elongation factor TFIIS
MLKLEGDKMGYLVCNKCGGTYELQEGESLDDFENCECGGKLEYVEDIEPTADLVKDKIGLKCPKCGHENLDNVKFCGSCGENLVKENKSIKPLFKALNFNIILIGSTLTILALILSKVLFFDIVIGLEPVTDSEHSLYTLIYFIIIFMGSFIPGTLKKLDYKIAALHGGIIMIFPATFFWISVLGFYNELLSNYVSSSLEGISLNLIFVLATAILVIVYIIVGSLGTFIGTFLNKKLNLSEKNVWIKSENYINKITNEQWKFGYLSFLITIILLSIMSFI